MISEPFDHAQDELREVSATARPKWPRDQRESAFGFKRRPHRRRNAQHFCREI